MEINIARDGKTLGSFSLEILKEMAAKGGIKLTDHAYIQEIGEWKMIAEVPELRDVLPFATSGDVIPPPPLATFTAVPEVDQSAIGKSQPQKYGLVRKIACALFVMCIVLVCFVIYESNFSADDSGSFTDSRDGHVYRYVDIGNQTWMAENLNYVGKNGDAGICYNNDTSSCRISGALYTWSEVMAGSQSSSSAPSNIQGICPNGWHVPSDMEWGTLIAYVGADSARIKLSSKSAWSNSGNGTDQYGFTVLPTGGRFNAGTFNFLGYDANFWSSSESGTSNAWVRDFGYDAADVTRDNFDKSYGFSLRCIKNK